MNIRTLILVFALLLTLSACGKDDDGGSGSGTGTAGKGGAAVLRITPRHHIQQIDSCMVYIKYNSGTGSEDPSAYDDSAKCLMENSLPVATFPGLKKGKYFIYGIGWDPFITKQVKGGVPYTVDTETVQNIQLFVTEPGH